MDQQQPPRCPRCGMPMEQRLARRGPRAGRPFWGCSRYPACRATVDWHPPWAEAAARRGEVPISWRPPRLAGGARVQFLSGSGRLGQVNIEALAREHPGAGVRQNLTNWCLIDHSAADPAAGAPLRVVQMLAIARKLLTRGRIPIVSPALEQGILQEVGLARRVISPGVPADGLWEILEQGLRDEDAEAIGQALVPVSPPGEPRAWRLDSPEEEYFYRHTFPAVVGPLAIPYLHPQVPLANLAAPDASPDGHVGFLFSPPGSPPVVIAIETATRRSGRTPDGERYGILARHGFEVISLAAVESSTGRGPAVARLRAVWESRYAPAERPQNWALDLVWMPVLATRIQLAVLHAVETNLLPPAADSWRMRVLERDLAVGSLALGALWELLTQLGALYHCSLLPRTLSVECFGLQGEGRSFTFGAAAAAQPPGPAVDLDVSAFMGYTLAPPPASAGAPAGWGDGPTIEIRAAYIPRLVLPPSCSAPPATLPEADPQALTYFLQLVFRKREFRDGQLEAVQRTLAGKDSIVLLPTGAGKSLIYQLSGLLLPGVTMVVDPIVALIGDQMYNLSRYGIDRAVGISSQLDTSGRGAALRAFGRAEHLFCFVAPERLQTQQFREECRSLNAVSGCNLWVIDEAHCVSEWGHDFRVAYLNLGRVARELGRREGFVPPLLALTGTASRAVLRDVQRELQVTEPDAVLTPATFDRPELQFRIIAVPSGQKGAALVAALKETMAEFDRDPATGFGLAGPQTMSGLVFCPHVNGHFGVVRVARELQEAFGIEVGVYAGTPPTGWGREEWNRAKEAISLRFKANEFPLLVCTKAFGMGIDKPNIRYTIHFGIPSSLEAFYQEAGRAGRDRQRALNLLLFSNDQAEQTAGLLSPDAPWELLGRMIGQEWSTGDDAARMLHFHLQSFRGVEPELQAVVDVVSRLGPVSAPEVRRLAYGDEREHRALGKAVHRLQLMGIVADYTLDYSGRQFELQVVPPTREGVSRAVLRYVQGYAWSRSRAMAARLEQGPADLPEFVLFAARVLVEFIYEVIELSRRSALREMWAVAAECRSDAEIRSRLLEYLQESRFSRAVAALAEAGALDQNIVGDILWEIAAVADAGELRGATIRLLESLPDHPGLLVLRGFLEVIIRGEATPDFEQTIGAALHSFRSRYGGTEGDLRAVKAWLVALARERTPPALEAACRICLGGDPALARALLCSHDDEVIAGHAVRELLAHLARRIETVADSIL